MRNAPAGNRSTRKQQLYWPIAAQTSTMLHCTILTAVAMKSTTFSEVLVEIYRHFGWTFCLRDRRESWARKQQVECCLLSHYTHQNPDDCTLWNNPETSVQYPDVAIDYTCLHSVQVCSGVHIIACLVSTVGFSTGIKLSGSKADLSPRNIPDSRFSFSRTPSQRR